MKYVALRRVVGLVLTVFLMIFIFSMSAQNAEVSNQTSGGVIRFTVSLLYPGFNGLGEQAQNQIISSLQGFVRSTAHFLVFALLGGLWLFAADCFLKKKWFKLSVSFAGSVLYAAFDEFHQTLVPGRSGEFRDVCIDAAGVLIGVFLSLLIGRLLRRRSAKKQAAAQ